MRHPSFASTAALIALVSASCSDSQGEAVDSVRGVVTGIVESAPTCPLERPNSPCPPRPVVGAEVAAYSGKQQVKTIHTGSDGRFKVFLAYGHYTIRATNTGGYPTTATKDVDVSATPTSVTLTVDSGIR